jgi:hypothetical protein
MKKIKNKRINDDKRLYSLVNSYYDFKAQYDAK